MKKSNLLLFTAISLTCLTSCGPKRPKHQHIFEYRKVVEAIVPGIMCGDKISYYKSCECGELSSESFKTNEIMKHDYEKDYVVNGNECIVTYTCKRCDKNHEGHSFSGKSITKSYSIDTPPSCQNNELGHEEFTDFRDNENQPLNIDPYFVGGTNSIEQKNTKLDHFYCQNVFKSALVPGTTNQFYENCIYCGKNDTSKTFTFNMKPEYTFAKEEIVERKNVYDYACELDPAMASIFAGYKTLNLRKYNFTYQSTKLDGTPITLSAGLIVPFDGDTPNVTALAVNNHPTIFGADRAPSLCWTPTTPIALCSTARTAVLECDLIGLGSTVDEISDFHCWHLTSKSTIDGIFAAYDILKEYFDVDCTDLKKVNAGYSQGGFDTMSILYYLEKYAPECITSKIKFNKVFAGSGAYDLQIMMKKQLRNDFSEPDVLIQAIISAIESHPDMFMGYTIEDFLEEYGLKYLDPLQRKDEYEIFRLNYSRNNKPIFKEALFDSYNELNRALISASKFESLLNTDWVPSANTYMYYSVKDEIIPKECSLKAKEKFANAQNIVFIEADNVYHEEGGTEFYTKVYLNF